jgi:hypothetical protein
MASALTLIMRLKGRAFSDGFYESKTAMSALHRRFWSVGRRDLSLRAVSVPVVLPARWVSVPKNSGIHGPGCRIEETQSYFHFQGVGVARVGCGALVKYAGEILAVSIAPTTKSAYFSRSPRGGI